MGINKGFNTWVVWCFTHTHIYKVEEALGWVAWTRRF